jgi:hypothetical protein
MFRRVLRSYQPLILNPTHEHIPIVWTLPEVALSPRDAFLELLDPRITRLADLEGVGVANLGYLKVQEASFKKYKLDLIFPASEIMAISDPIYSQAEIRHIDWLDTGVRMGEEVTTFDDPPSGMATPSPSWLTSSITTPSTPSILLQGW